MPSQYVMELTPNLAYNKHIKTKPNKTYQKGLKKTTKVITAYAYKPAVMLSLHDIVLSVIFQSIVPSGITEEVNELFVPENKLKLVQVDAITLPTISITKVTTHLSTTNPYFFYDDPNDHMSIFDWMAGCAHNCL